MMSTLAYATRRLHIFMLQVKSRDSINHIVSNLRKMHG